MNETNVTERMGNYETLGHDISVPKARKLVFPSQKYQDCREPNRKAVVGTENEPRTEPGTPWSLQTLFGYIQTFYTEF